MKKITINSIEELAEIMHDDAHDGNCVTAILFYDEAIKLMRELMSYDCIIPESFEISPVDFNGYDKEYFVQLGNDMMLAVEKAWRENIPLYCLGDISYIDRNVSDAVKDKNEAFCVYVDFDSDINDDNCECDLCDDCIYDDKLDKLIASAKVVKDKDGDIVEYKFDLDLFLDYLFGE